MIQKDYAMSEDQIIDQIIHSFLKYNLRDIQEINNNKLDFTIAEFILCSCFIDQISGFRYNKEKVGERYRDFVQEYLPQYNSIKLYEDLQNKLVHNYSICNFYGLTRNAVNLHLQNVNGKIIINLENFIEDLKVAFDRYIFQLKNDAIIRQNASNWYSKNKILSLL